MNKPDRPDWHYAPLVILTYSVIFGLIAAEVLFVAWLIPRLLSTQ